MIDAAQFVEAARARGFDWYSGVPCSYLTPFIDHVLQDASLHYVSAANEGDAVALIAGVTLAGGRGVAMMQNSGLGNAVSPLTSLAWTFRLPQLLIVTWRGQPGVPDEPQHALMGPITPAMLDTMRIAHEPFPTEAEAIGPALDRAVAHMETTGLPYALVMQKGSVGGLLKCSSASSVVVPAKAGTQRRSIRPQRHWAPAFAGATADASRREALQRILAHTPIDSTIVVASTGYCGRELYALDDRPNQLYMVGSMGCVTSFALGIALTRPDLRVVALDGDGAALMRMGAFATIGAYGPANFLHVLLDNGVHDSTGGQATVSSAISFAGIAAACGYASAIEGDDVALLDAFFTAADGEGPRFVAISIRAGASADLPRPTIEPPAVKERLMRHMRTMQEVGV